MPAGRHEMEKYECELCEYIYDPAQGDPDSGIKAGTSFNTLPENWYCPACGIEKTGFKPAR